METSKDTRRAQMANRHRLEREALAARHQREREALERGDAPMNPRWASHFAAAPVARRGR
jgi:hypothetical protein